MSIQSSINQAVNGMMSMIMPMSLLKEQGKVKQIKAEQEALKKSNEELKTSNEELKNAYKYGFIYRFPQKGATITGFRHEPWHYRYVGVEAAKYIYENNMTLEEYYALFLDN